ncbi:MAG: transposase, partial [Pseudanabaena sp.]
MMFKLSVKSLSKLSHHFMDAMDILPNFDGISVHDGLSSYAQYDCKHALCNAHHLRELIFIVERYQQPWAELMLSLLVEIKDQIGVAKTDGISALPSEKSADFERR